MFAIRHQFRYYWWQTEALGNLPLLACFPIFSVFPYTDTFTFIYYYYMIIISLFLSLSFLVSTQKYLYFSILTMYVACIFFSQTQIFNVLASIFPSAASWSNWGSPTTNLYPSHSMSHTSHVTPHSYHSYMWPTPPGGHTTTVAPAVTTCQLDNFEIYKKLSPYE